MHAKHLSTYPSSEYREDGKVDLGLTSPQQRQRLAAPSTLDWVMVLGHSSNPTRARPNPQQRFRDNRICDRAECAWENRAPCRPIFSRVLDATFVVVRRPLTCRSSRELPGCDGSYPVSVLLRRAWMYSVFSKIKAAEQRSWRTGLSGLKRRWIQVPGGFLSPVPCGARNFLGSPGLCDFGRDMAAPPLRCATSS